MSVVKGLALVLVLVFLTSSCIVTTEFVYASSATENTWEVKAPMPGAMDGGRTAVVNGKIYAICGLVNYQYDPATDTWIAKKPMPTPRALFGIAVCQNKIFTVGGASFTNGNPTYYAVNEVYDPATDTWQTKQPMPTTRIHLGACAVDGLLYLVGGIAGEPHNEVLALNEVYNVANDSWTTKEPMLYAVNPDASAVCAGKIYVLSGSSTQIYDPLNDSWSMGAPMPTAEEGAAVAATTGVMALRMVYVFGGFGPHYDHLEDAVQVYDPESNTWAYGTPMPTARGALTTVVLYDKIYAIGGSIYRNNEVYTPFGYGSPDPAYVWETTPPKLSLLSPLRQTYNTTNVTLVFTMDKPISWAGYSLDGEANITTVGNTTLTFLSSGLHNITLYANDAFGNMGISETSVFTVTLPIMEHSEPFPISTILAISIAIVIIPIVVMLLYRRHRKQIHLSNSKVCGLLCNRQRLACGEVSFRMGSSARRGVDCF